MLPCASLENEFRQVSMHLCRVRNILQINEEWKCLKKFSSTPNTSVQQVPQSPISKSTPIHVAPLFQRIS